MKTKSEISKLIEQMTLEEKASLCSGMDFWHTQSIERLNIPSIMLADGPHGLRKQAGEADHVGINESVPAACFPTASALASSWDRELLKTIGSTLAETCLEEKVGVLLGPGINIKRSPLCGRNFEYFSEDPVLSGELAASMIEGVQSQGIGTSLKHFAANNQEKNRMTIDTVVDERALRELYLAGFETAVKKSQPFTIMCAYNKINGGFASENKYLLTDILREEWKFNGIVVSDWGAVNNRPLGVDAGLDLEMPATSGLNDELIVKAVKNNTLEETILDNTVKRVLNLVFKCKDNETDNFKYDRQKHHELTIKAASESMVLLKNEDNILPINKQDNIALIGEFAENPRYQGTGSSLINPFRLDKALDCSKQYLDKAVSYAKGYDCSKDTINPSLIKEAVGIASKCNTAIIIAGLTAEYESEGFDRTHMRLPESHNALIEAVAEVNKNTIVVLCSGAPVEMPWINKVKSVVQSYLSGQGGGSALWKLLTGEINFSGKLAETFPIKAEDCSSHNFFPMGPDSVEYRESLLNGYRWFDFSNKEVLFPFGFGLSYTNFTYSKMELSSKELSKNDKLSVKLSIKNTGQYPGSEIVQLYVSDNESSVFRPKKELKNFTKVFLNPGEEKSLVLELNKRDFSFYSPSLKKWIVESGEFTISAAASSRDVRLSENITYISENKIPEYEMDLKNKAPVYFSFSENITFSKYDFEKVLGYKITTNEQKSFHRNSTFEQARKNFFGKILYNKILKSVTSNSDNSETSKRQMLMMEAIIREMPLRNLLSQNGITHAKIDALIDLLNGKLIKGIYGLYFKK